MNSISKLKIVMICCSVLQVEVESICQAHWPDYSLRFLPSMMHMHPERLAPALQLVLGDKLKQGYKVILIYGDCCAQMKTLEAMPGVVRTQGKNCCELLLGPKEYRRLSHDGVFFLIPEWSLRWKEIFSKELGLNSETATSMMKDIHRKLIYLDTGLVQVYKKALKEFSGYCGLPFEVQAVSLEHLCSAIEDAICRCKTTGTSL